MSLDRLAAFIPQDGDVQLGIRLKRHEPEALADLFDRLGVPTLAIITRMVGDENAAAALLEETFLTVWNRIGEHQGAGLALGFWILAVARTRAFHHLQNSEALAAGRFDDPQIFADLPFGRSELVGLRNMHAAWFRLGDKHRQIIEWAFFQGMSRAQIAVAAGEPPAAVDGELKAALAVLRTLPVKTSRSQVGQEEREQTDQRQE